jgi:3-methyladenine DNA glycosylase AlkD
MNLIREKLISLADADYKAFTSPLIPNEEHIMGVRLPVLRKMAKEISRGDWQAYLKTCGCEYHEEILLKGLVIGYSKTDPEKQLEEVADFVPFIHNWAVCDSFCMNLTFAGKNRERVWAFLETYFTSSNEFDVRFGVIMILSWFVLPEYARRIFDVCDKIQNEGYYAKMAVAWLLQKCFIKFPEETLAYLSNNMLDDFTYNKALQKIIESKIPSQETKDLVRSMKRKVKQNP